MKRHTVLSFVSLGALFALASSSFADNAASASGTASTFSAPLGSGLTFLNPTYTDLGSYGSTSHDPVTSGKVFISALASSDPLGSDSLAFYSVAVPCKNTSSTVQTQDITFVVSVRGSVADINHDSAYSNVESTSGSATAAKPSYGGPQYTATKTRHITDLAAGGSTNISVTMTAQARHGA